MVAALQPLAQAARATPTALPSTACEQAVAHGKLADNWAWLCEFEQSLIQSRAAKKGSSLAVRAVDAALAAYEE